MRPIDDNSLAEALALNNRFATELSFQTRESFAALVRNAYFAAWTEGREGFLIAFTEGANYAGANFRWFQTRHERFVYVDRLVVKPEARGAGHARQLYAALFAQMDRDARRLVTCEVNSDPPNPASEAFHARLGFRPVGEALIDGGAKTVTYLALERLAG